MEEFQVGDIVDTMVYGENTTTRVLSLKHGDTYFVQTPHGFISMVAMDHNGMVKERGIWKGESDIKLNKEAKVLKILRQYEMLGNK